MKTLIMARGLPGSGKTTWALQETTLLLSGRPASHVIRVNKDDIRRALEITGWTWTREGEAAVIEQRNLRITAALADPRVNTVISDDTNLDPKHEQVLRMLAHNAGAKFVIKDFLTPVDECIRRDALRTGKACVGEDVIRKMARRYPHWQSLVVEPYKPDMALPNAIICDLDGTLSLFGPGLNDRSPYDAQTCHLDVCNLPIRQILEVYYRFMDYRIVYLSGRFDTFRPQTEMFLRNNHCPPGDLFMRTAGDTCKDDLVKYELFNAHVRNTYCIKFVLDDRPRVLRMWQALGLTTLAVGPLGEF